MCIDYPSDIRAADCDAKIYAPIATLTFSEHVQEETPIYSLKETDLHLTIFFHKFIIINCFFFFCANTAGGFPSGLVTSG